MKFIHFLRQSYNRSKVRFGGQPIVTSRLDYRLLQKISGKGFPSWRQIYKIKKVLGVGERRVFNGALILLAVAVFWLLGVLLFRNLTTLPAVGGIYIEAEVGSVESVNPVFASTNDVDVDITQLVFSGLMRYDQNLKLIPDLAVHYKISDDKKMYTFELKKDVLWHDGEKFTAKDVVFTVGTIQTPEVNSPLGGTFQGVTVTAMDDYTVRFTLPQPFPSFLTALTLGIIPEHLWFDVEPGEMRFAQANLKPVGTGPFKFKKMTKDESGHIYQYELERVDKYYQPGAHLQQFIFQLYPSYEGNSGALQAFREQKVNGLSFVPYNLRDKVDRKHIDVHTLQLPQYTALFFNAYRQPILKDKNVRLALAHAIDKNRIVREVLKNDGQVIDGPILPGFTGYDGNAQKYQYSPSDANKLLDQKWNRLAVADFRKIKKEKLLKEWKDTRGSATTTEEMIKEEEKQIDEQLDGDLSPAQTFFRQDKQGNLLELNLISVDNEQYKETTQLVAGFWQELGVKTNVKLVSTKEISREVLKNRAYDVLLYGEIVGSDVDPYPFWHSSQVDFPGLNLAHYSNNEVDALIEKARATVDESDQISLYQKFQKILITDLPAIFLYMPTYTYATMDGIKGISVERIAKPADRFVEVTNWYMKTRWGWK